MLKLEPMGSRESIDERFSARREPQIDPAAIGGRRGQPPHQLLPREAIDQPHRAVVMRVELLGELSH